MAAPSDTAGDDTLRFAVCTFQRVFDVHPCQDAMTLPELTAAFQRFLVKPKLKARIDGELAKIEEAVAAFERGETRPGKRSARLSKKVDEAVATGVDRQDAIAQVSAQFQTEAKREAKKDQRLWAPILYTPDGRRETEDVLHLSCMVLDYDDGTAIDVSRNVWGNWFHLLHTTWSHTEAYPKYRVILPLAAPLSPRNWRTLWMWCADRASLTVDPTGKAVARAYAIPVASSIDAPRVAYAHSGPFLDAVAEGLVDGPSDHPIPPQASLSSCLLRVDPKAHYISGSFTPVDEEDEALWDGGAYYPEPSNVTPIRGAVSVVPPLADDPVQAQYSEILARLDALAPSALVDDLERLSMLHGQGALTDAEFARAKTLLLRDG